MLNIRTDNEKEIKSAVVLGSTGSVGRQTLDVLREVGIRADMLAAKRNVDLLAEQILEFRPAVVSVDGEEYALKLREILSQRGYCEPIEVLYNKEEILDCVKTTTADMIFHSVAGLEGFDYALAAAQSGKRIGMANKEAVIAAGDLIIGECEKNGGEIIPVDSEHSAVYRLLEGRNPDDVKRIVLTASGGPFRGKTFEELKKVTLSDALKHPTWKMGVKITVDSATLMNKGFEVIEAVRLFGVDESRVGVVVHPQSIIHSLIEYNDNTMTSQMGRPDMRDCIRYAATAPHPGKVSGEGLNLAGIGSLTFFEPDEVSFPLLRAARDAVRIGGCTPAALIAADEEAVAAFVAEKIGFTDISSFVIETLGKIDVSYEVNAGSIREAVTEARRVCRECMNLK